MSSRPGLTAAVVVGTNFWRPAGQDIAILIGIGVAGFVLGVVVLPILQGLFGAVRSAGSQCNHADHDWCLLTIAAIFVRSTFPSVSAARLAGNFVVRRGLSVLDYAAQRLRAERAFLLPLRAPTALGRPIMDQLAGFKLYLETAESGQLNLQAPEITAQRFEAILPYAVALDVEKPWAQAFAAALRRAHPDDTDPMHHY
jgi:hypothetical protein